MIINHTAEKSQAIIQSSLSEITKLSNLFKKNSLGCFVRHYDSFSEVVISLNTHDAKKTFIDLMKKQNLNHTLIKYDFCSMEKSLEKHWNEGFTFTINKKYHQNFTNIQSAMRFFVDSELDRLGVDVSFKETTLYYSLLSTMMAEIISKKGYLSGPRFIAEYPLDVFAQFYHALDTKEAQRLHSLSVEALSKLGYDIF